MGGVRRRSGGTLLVVLVAIAAVAAAGAWNYRRNLEAEQAVAAARPLSGYSTGDLEALAAAYRQEIDAHEARYEARRGQRVAVRDQAYFDDQVREFERVQRASAQTRGVGAAVSEREAELARIEDELRSRTGQPEDWERFFARLLTF